MLNTKEDLQYLFFFIKCVLYRRTILHDAYMDQLCVAFLIVIFIYNIFCGMDTDKLLFLAEQPDTRILVHQ